MKARLRTHDLRAVIAWLRQYAYWPSFEDLLRQISHPCTLYAGENDWCYARAQQAAKEMRDATFVPIPNGGHLEDGTWVHILQPHIKTLVARATS